MLILVLFIFSVKGMNKIWNLLKLAQYLKLQIAAVVHLYDEQNFAKSWADPERGQVQTPPPPRKSQNYKVP